MVNQEQPRIKAIIDVRTERSLGYYTIANRDNIVSAHKTKHHHSPIIENNIEYSA